ncbi:hypothetical protein SSYRP_v1c05460 [Spiroplasma syrphidicola EA-1]|uniref:Transmembrane protein n=1 Tax=Spiroplasma syrphidicola EA-1 TaxID=1276229 RepID=R4ULQ7_9MOLU|nr:hypothetical protein [Spiroplasma syrphidicola]AGM26136.1 hypothetical protein SSYRP_v1c05460 [Spiroplasma syrphidicola EA-1]
MEKPANNLQNEAKMSFQEYKILVTKDDIIKFEKNLKPFWWENIPVIGTTIYAIRTGIKQSEIDRGLLRKEITVAYTIFVFAFLIYLYGLLYLLTPWFGYWINRTGLKRAKKKLAELENETKDLK